MAPSSGVQHEGQWHQQSYSLSMGSGPSKGTGLPHCLAGLWAGQTTEMWEAHSQQPIWKPPWQIQGGIFPWKVQVQAPGGWHTLPSGMEGLCAQTLWTAVWEAGESSETEISPVVSSSVLKFSDACRFLLFVVSTLTGETSADGGLEWLFLLPSLYSCTGLHTWFMFWSNLNSILEDILVLFQGHQIVNIRSSNPEFKEENI